MTDSGSLSPPKRTGTADPGAHDVENSDSEDHFSDAQQSVTVSPDPTSPVPRTRVEKVSDEPSYGEVPGTDAYRLREGDAEPDEIAIIPDKKEEAAVGSDRAAASLSPGGQPVPKTIVEEAPGNTGPHSKEFEKRIETEHVPDASPDVVVKAGGGEGGEGAKKDVPDSPISPTLKSPTSDRARRKSDSLPSPMSSEPQSDQSDSAGVEEGDENNGFGDDFDDFEEGGGDDDFDDFEDGFQEPEAPEAPAPAPAPAPPPVAAPPAATLPFPIPDFEGLDSDDISNALDPYINALFPPDDHVMPELPPLPKENTVFVTPRSASLWSQLVAPPPLAPPDWIRSRIRRLFLVSLGVPVDLDEILPASKQKKLILPSLSLHPGSSASPRASTDSRLGKLKQSGVNSSSTSVDSQGKPSASRRRKGPPPEPDLDLVSAKQLCETTDEALSGMTDGELKAHLAKLQALESKAREALEYWQKRTDEKIGDREAFEGVIENLVKHARKVRK